MKIEVNEVSMVYPSGKHALQSISLQMECPNLIGILGPNGAGKTTLMKLLIAGLIPTSGKILLDGKALLSQEKRLKSQLGYLPQSFGLYDELTVWQFIDYMAALKGIQEKAAIDNVLERVSMADQRKVRLRSLSGGQRQRVGIAQALLGNPRLLILDEPTNGLDPEGIKEIRVLIQKLNQERKITVLISSHILGELSKLATRYGIIHNGQLIEEFTEEELRERCKSGIVINVHKDDVEKCTAILREELKTTNFKIGVDGVIHLYDFVEQTGMVNQVLAKNDIIVNSISADESDLEDYFLKVIGGRK